MNQDTSVTVMRAMEIIIDQKLTEVVEILDPLSRQQPTELPLHTYFMPWVAGVGPFENYVVDVVAAGHGHGHAGEGNLDLKHVG
jgi:hypothetical protein